jgi:hypothetical protein
MSDDFMAIDARLLAGEKRAVVSFHRTRSLLGYVHGLGRCEIGHGVRAKRSRSGAVSFDVLDTEATHAPIQ